MQKNLLARSAFRKLLGSNVQLWLVGSLIALSLLWLTIITEIDRDHQLLIKQGEAEAASLASNYAKQTDFLFLQIDQLSFFLSTAATGPNAASAVQKMIDTLPKESLINPFFADANGIVHSSRTNAAINVDISQQPYFIEHRNSESLKLKIQKPTQGIGYLKGKTVIRFSRRLNNKDGNFGGVITIGILQDELSNKIASSSLGPNDVAGIKFGSGEWLSYHTIGRQTKEAPILEPLAISTSHDLGANMLINNKLSVFNSAAESPLDESTTA